MASNTVNISGTAVRMSNLRQSLNIFGDPISLGSARAQASSLPDAGSSISLSANCKNFINAYNPLISLDANNYQTVAPTTWSDNSGNNNNFTIGANVYSNVGGVTFMNFASTNAVSATSANIPLTYANGATILAFSRVNPVATNPRTLVAGISSTAAEYMNPAAATYLQNSANWTNPTTGVNTVTLSGYAYGNGTYVASASSFYSSTYVPWTLFDKASTQDWATAGAYYTGTTQLTAQTPTGAATQMTVSGVTIYGEWIQIQMPSAILLSSYTYNGANTANSGQSPRDWIIAGSSDGSTWVNLDSRTGVGTIPTANGLSATYTLTGNTTSYAYYRFIIRATNGNGYAAMSQWTLYTANSSGDKMVSINSATNSIGIFDNINASGFNAMTNPGVFDISTLASYSNTFNMLAIKMQTTSPYYQVKYNGQTSSNYYTNNSSVNASLKSGIGYIGGNNNAEYWGQVGLMLVYNSILPDTQITDIYNRFAPRFYYYYPPVATNLIGYYNGDSWTGSQWSDLSGSGNHAVTVTGTIRTYNNIQSDNSAVAYQALNGHRYLAGGTTAGITFPAAILPQTYTLLWVARYAGLNQTTLSGAGTNQRIFDATTSDWLSGFSGGLAGVAKHGTNWVTQNSVNVYGNNWIIGSDQTNVFRANSSNLSIVTGVAGTYNLTVNNGFNKATQASDWMVATVLVYSRELTTVELNTMELWLAQKYNLTAVLRLHALDRITSRDACVGAFGLVKLNARYNGPIIKVRNGTNNVVMDFYADVNGALTIAPDGTGLTLATWLGAATGFIDTWYDQSGTGNHAVQNATVDGTALQPTIDVVNRMVSFRANSGVSRLRLPNGTIPSGDGSYSVILKHNTQTGTGFLGSGATNVTNGNNSFGISGTNYNNYWWGNDATTSAGSLVATGNVVTFKYTTAAFNNRVAFVNGTTQGLSFTGSTTVRSSTTVNNYIGIGDLQNNNYLNGELYYVYIFNTNISYSDQNTLEQTGFFIAPLSGAAAGSITATSMTLSWTQTNGYQYTLLSWNAGANSAIVIYGKVTFSNFTAGNALSPNVSYTFTLTPYYNLNVSGNPATAATGIAASSSATTATAVTLPTVSGVSISAVTANSITVGWSAPGTPATYNTVVVSWSPSTAGSPATAITAASGTVTYTSPTNLAFNTQYTFTVTPSNSVSVAGTGVSAAATYTLAGSLVGQTISATVNGFIATITWTDTNSPAATNYTVTWSSGSATTSNKNYTTGTLAIGTYTFTVTPNNVSAVGNPGGAITSNSVNVTSGIPVLTASATPSVTDMNNTVLLMNFNGANNSTLFTDSSFNSQQFTVFGQATLSSLIPSKFGLTAGYFPGGSYIQSSTNILNNLGNNNFTIEFWFYWNGVNQNPGFPQIVISNNNSSALTTGYSGSINSISANTWSIGLTSFSNNAGTKMAFTYYNQVPSVTIPSISVVPQNQWTHYAFARNGSSLSVFVNGALETVGYIPVLGYIDDGITSRALFIGCGFANQYLYGALNDLRIITNTVKYTANFTLPDDSTYDAYDYNTILLLHGNGANNATTFTDSSVFGTTLTNPSNSTVISTTQSYFGGSSISFNGTTSILQTPSSSLFAFAYSDFTIEFWFRATGITNTRLMGNSTGSWAANNWQISTTAGGFLQFGIFGLGSIVGTTAPALNTWHHFALIRVGNTVTIYLNGASYATSGSYTSPMDSGASRITIGSSGVTGDPIFSGFINELRITKGLARYTAPFQVPTMPFKPYLNGVQDDPVVLLLRGEGGTIVDSSYYATQFATPQGTPQNSTAQFKFGTSSISLSSASIRTPTSTLYSFGANDFTIEFWSYASIYNAIRFTGNLNPSWAANTWYFGTNASSQLLFGTFNLTPNPILTSTVTPPINTWNHIALVRNGTVFMIFLNGILVASNSVTGTIDNNAAVRLSIGDAGENGAYFNGFIDEFCITRGIAKYTGNFTPDIAPFLTNQPYDFSNAATILLLHGEDLHNSTGIIDSSYYQQPITNPNSRTIISTTYSPPFANSSIFFNGTAYINTPSSSLNTFTTSDFTIEFYMYLTVATNSQKIFGNSTGTFTGGVWQIDVSPGSSTLRFLTPTVTCSVSVTINTNVWYHIAVCRIGAVLYIFVNGVRSSFALTGAIDTAAANPLYIGWNGVTADTVYFTGYLDEVRITRGIARYLQNFTPVWSFVQPYGVPLTVPITLLLHFDGVNGATVHIDSSPINAAITTSGTAPALTTATTSPVSSCTIGFVGSNNTFVATPSSLYYALGANNFTIEFWFNATTISATSFILFNAAYGTTYAANMWRLGFNSTANLQLSIWNIGTNANVFLTTNTTFATGLWYHFTMVRNNNTFMIYINGQLDISGVTTASMDGGAASLICIGSVAASNSFTGFIDEFFFSNGYAKYISNFTLPTTPIINMVNADDIPANATVLLLHGDGTNAGTTFTDSSIYQNGISGSGTTTSTAQIRFGTSSLLFNATGNLATPSSSIFSLNNNDFTIEFWIYFTTVPTAQVVIMGNLPGSYTTNSWTILYQLSTTRIALLTNNQGSVYAQSSSTPVANRWIHYAFVRNGNSLIVYQDGVGVFYPTYFASAPLIDALSTAYTVYIGGGGGTDPRMSGYLDEVRITKGYAVYTANFIPPVAPMIAKPVVDVLATPNVTLLLHAEGANGTISATNPVIDSSYYNNTVSLLASATPSYTTASFRFGNSSFSFNGYANSVQNALRTSALPGFDTGDFTIEFWINISSFASQMRYFGNVSPTFYYEIGHGPGGQPFLNALPGLLLLSGVSAGTWTHLAFVRYNNRLFGYVNGILSNSMAFVGSIDNNASYTIDIGGCGYNSGQPNATFTGNIDEIRITKGFAQYTRNFTSSTMPFPNPQQQGSSVTLLMHCEGANGSVNLVDSSPYQNTLTNVNYAQISTANSVYGGSSLYLPNAGTAYIQTASTTYNNLGTGDFTIEFWFNWSGAYATGYQRLMSNTTAAFAANFWYIGFTNNSNNGTAAIGFIANNISANVATGYYSTKTIPVANTWYHFAITRQGTSFYVFLNGILENTYTGVATAVDDGSTVRVLNIGGNPGDSQYFYGYMDEIRVTKGIARYTGSFSLPTKSYMTYTTPLIQQVTPAQIYPLDGLSPVAIKNAKALYAVVRLLSSYTGAIITVRRGLDNVTLDFYSDASGNLVSNLNGTGISLGAWLLGTIGYITQWYDQSGQGNDATQTTAASQPIINAALKYIDFRTQSNSFFNLPSGTIPQQRYYSVILRHNTTGNGNTAVGSLLGGGANSNNQGNYFFTNASGVYTNSWISNDFSSHARYISGAVCSWVFGTPGLIGTTTSGVTSFYMNGTLASSPQVRTGWAGVAGNETIGTNTPTANAALNGELYFVTIFNISLTDADRTIVEKISSSSQAGLPSSATSLIANYDLTNSLSYTGNQSPCCLDGLSYAALLSAKGLYACIRLLTKWTGPVMNVRRGSDNILMDFYADANGNLGTGFNATGASLESWLAGTIGYVTIWYDQSGLGNHGTQTATGSQPAVDINGRLLNFYIATNTVRFVLPDGTFPSGDGSYTIILRHGKLFALSNGNIGLFGSGTGAANSCLCSLVTAITGGSGAYRLYHYGNDVDSTTGTIIDGRVVSYTYLTGAGTNSRKIYLDGTLNIQNSPTAVRNSGTANNFIGYSESTNNNYLNGQLYYITIFASVLSNADRNIVENIGRFNASAIVADLSGNKNNLTLTYAPSITNSVGGGQGANSYVNINTSGTSQNTTVVDLSNGFTMETLVATKNTSTPTYNLNNGTGVSSSVGAGASTVFGTQSPMEFPPLAMSGTGATSQSTVFTTAAYGNGTYIVSCSASQASFTPALAFNKVTDTFGWQSTAGVYTTTGVYNTTTYTTVASGQTFFGEWLQMRMPTCVYATSYSLTCSNGGTTQFPYSWLLVGSNDGSSWILLDNRNTQVAAIGRTFTYTIANPGPFIFYRIIVTGIQLGNAAVSAALISEMRFYGDVVIPNYVSTSLLGYWDFSIPSSYIGAGTALNDISGNGLNMTISNAGTYSQYPYAMTTGTNTGFTVGYTTGFATGFTVELLVNLSSTTGNQWIFQTGAYGTAGMISLLNSGTQLQCYISNLAYPNIPYATTPLQAGVWGHLIISASQASGAAFYYNGVAVTMTANPSLASAFPLTAGSSMFIGNGTNAGFAGSCAMARVYTYALSANDAMQNYMNIVGTTNPYNLTTNNYVSDSLLVYPPVSLASATAVSGSGSYTNSLWNILPVFSFFVSGQTYGNGMYYISASSQYNASTSEQVPYIFDKNTATFWTDNNAESYTGTSSAYSGSVYTIANGNTYLGSWMQLQLPSAINLVSYQLFTRSNILTRGPNIFYLLGSNDGNTWYYIEGRSGVTGWTASGFTFRLNTVSNAYSYFRIVINRLNNTSASDYATIAEWYLYGINGTPSGTEIQMSSQGQLEYPPLPMSANSTNFASAAYGNGLYIATASTSINASAQPFTGFNKNIAIANTDWNSSTAGYNTSTGLYSANTYSTIIGSTTVYGEWLQIQLPSQIILKQYNISSASYTDTTQLPKAPYSWQIAGSTNGTTWSFVDIQVNITFTANAQEKTFILPASSTAYNYYRIVVTNVRPSNANGYLQIGEWRLFSNSISNSLTVINNNNATNKSNQYTDIVSEYPPAAMTANSTTLASRNYGNGAYVASASSEYAVGYQAFNAFDKVLTETGWIALGTAPDTYNTSTGVYNGTTTTLGYPGAWCQIQLPYPINISYYTIIAPSISVAQTPSTWRVYGSNDAINWILIDTRTSISWTASQLQTFYTPSLVVSYSYYRIVVNAVQNTGGGGTGYVRLIEWRLYGASAINNTFVGNTTNSLNPTGAITPGSLEYPPTGLSSNATTITNNAYGNGLYNITTSTAQIAGYYTFDKNTALNANRWVSAASIYNTTSGAYVGSVLTFINPIGNVYGEWIQIQLPVSLILKSYSMTTFNTGTTQYLGFPYNWIIAGSNDGTNWFIVDIQYSQPFGSSNLTKTYNTSLSTAYTYYRFVTQTMQPSNPYGQIEFAEWRLYGYSATTPSNYIPPNTIPVNNWTHGILTVSKAGVWSWYLNGVLNSTGGGFIIPTNVANFLAIGDYAGLDSLCGTIVLSRLYNRTLTTAQTFYSYANVSKNYTLQTKVIDVSGNNQLSPINVPTIPNASFEFPPITIGTSSQGVGTVSGWNTMAGVGLNTIGSGFSMSIVPDGNQVLLLQSNNTYVNASTFIYGLTPGLSYTITFFLGMRNAATPNKPNNFILQVNNTAVFLLSKFDNQFTIATNAVNTSFIQYTTNAFTATASTALLRISVYSPSDSTYYVDNMSIQSAYVPVSLSTVNTPYIPNGSFEVFLPNTLAASTAGYVSLGDSNSISSSALYSIPGWFIPGTAAGNVYITNSGSGIGPPTTMIDGNVCIGLQLLSTTQSPRIRTIITGLTPGQNYVVSFYVAYRTTTNQSNLIVTVDGYEVYNNPAVTFTTFTRQSCAPFWAQSQTAVLEFAVTTLVSGTDSTNFIDLVTISPNTAQNTLSAPVIPNGSFEYTTPSYSQNDPFFSNVVALLHLNNNLVDSSAINASITNFATTFNNSIVKFGTHSAAFNGSSSYLQTPTNINYAFGSGDFTVECWVYFNSTTYPAQRVWSNNLNFVANSMYLTLNAGYVYFQVNGGVALQGATQAITTGIWYHIAITKSGTTYRQFVNGVLDGSATSATNVDNGTSAQFYIGRCFASEFLNGYIDEFRVTKGLARYTANFQVLAAPLPDYSGANDPYFSNVVALLNFNANITSDSSQYGATITAGTGATYNTSTIRFGTGSLAINGTAGAVVYTPTSSVYVLTTQSFTMEFWIYLTSFTSSSIMGTSPSGGNPGSTNWWGMYFSNTAGAFNFEVKNATPSTVLLSGTIPSTGAWHHVAVVRNGNTFYLFVNGTQSSTRTNTVSMDNGTTNAIYVGGYIQNAFPSLNGFIDDFRFTKGVARYTTAFSVPTTAFQDYNVRYASVVSSAITTPNTVIPYWNTTNNAGIISGASYFGTNALFLLQLASNIATNPATAVTSIYGLVPGQSYVLQLYVFVRQFGSFAANLKININNVNVYTGIGITFNSLTLITTNAWTATGTIATLQLMNDFSGSTSMCIIDTIRVVSRTTVNNAIIQYVPPEQNLIQFGSGAVAYGGIKYGPVYIDGVYYYVHRFTATGNTYFTVNGGVLNCDILVVAGGGGTAIETSGGGGGGGVQYFTNQVLNTGSYTVTVGAGGQGSSTGTANAGGNSQFGTLPASIGGGAGNNTTTLGTGGSGGGISGNAGNAAGTFGQGFSGGSGLSSGNYESGGGGGAGGPGRNGVVGTPGVGGIGVLNNITGVAVYYGGGGGGAWNGSSTGASGGLGGGGTAGNTPTSGLPNTGGGGGGINNFTGTGTAGSPGGSGVVIVRYPVSGSFIPQSLGDPYYSNTVLSLHLNNNVTDTSTMNATITNTSVTFNNSIVRFGTHSAVFNGTTGYLQTPSSTNYSFGTGPVTIEFWYYGTTLQWGIFGNVQTNSGTWAVGGYQINVNASGQFLFNWYGPSALPGALIYTTSTLSANTWYHLAVVRNGASMTLYVNGVGQTFTTNITTSTSLDFAGANTLTVGWSGITSDSRGACYIDDLRITKGVARYSTDFLVPQFAFPDNLGNQVLEYPSARLLTYIPSAGSADIGLTNTVTISTAGYGNGVYVASMSSGADTKFCPPATAFDKIVYNQDQCLSAANRYTTTSGAYAGAVVTAGISGEWVQIQLPNMIILTSYSILSFNSTSGTFYLRTPYAWTILGSNNGSTWSIVHIQYGQTYTGYNQSFTFNVSTNLSFCFYRIVIQRTQPGTPDGFSEIGEWRLFGY